MSSSCATSDRCLPLQWAGDGSSRYLLPITPRLLIAHQKILVVDSSEVEVKFSTVQSAGPDQTRVAERSIRDGDRQLVQPVIHHVVVSHLANWIRTALSAYRHRDDHVVRIHTGLAFEMYCARQAGGTCVRRDWQPKSLAREKLETSEPQCIERRTDRLESTKRRRYVPACALMGQRLPAEHG